MGGVRWGLAASVHGLGRLAALARAAGAGGGAAYRGGGDGDGVKETLAQHAVVVDRGNWHARVVGSTVRRGAGQRQ